MLPHCGGTAKKRCVLNVNITFKTLLLVNIRICSVKLYYGISFLLASKSAECQLIFGKKAAVPIQIFSNMSYVMAH